jgi:hypothetical protein
MKTRTEFTTEAFNRRFGGHAINSHLPEVQIEIAGDVYEEERAKAMRWEDAGDEWDGAIRNAEPMNSGSHHHYATAMNMVGNRHSKASLVSLTNWHLVERSRLVAQIETKSAELAKAEATIAELRADLSSLYEASESVAMLQPAAYAKSDAESALFQAFYDSLRVVRQKYCKRTEPK